MNGIITKQIDNVWYASLDHQILGHVDGRSGTEQWAINNLLAELRVKAEAFNREKYKLFKLRYPQLIGVAA